MDINRNAPVVASSQTSIRAPRAVVWSIQTDINRWPEWNHAVTRAECRGPISPGTRFRWKSSGLMIVSTIQEVVDRSRLVWSGRATWLGIDAVHRWTFDDAQGGTLVRTEESFEGLLVSLMRPMMRKMLASSLDAWLADLKAESERRGPTA
jgi:uncharacterized protein YndB with AHSA1/START domain